MYTLDDICSVITDGSHFSPEDEGVGYPMLSVKDMGETDFDFSTCKHVGEEAYQKLLVNGCKPEVNDVVMAKDGSYLKSAFPVKKDREIALLSSIAILRPKLEMVTPEYLSHFLKSPSLYRTVSLNYISGTALKRVILKGIKKIPVELPTVEEQRYRTSLLNDTFRIIQLRKLQLIKLDDLIKARFVEMFGDPVSNSKGWRMMRFDSICENLDSRRKPITASEREAGEYPYYGASGIVDYVADYIFDEDILLVSEDGANLLMRSTPIAFSVSGKVWVNNHAHVVRFNDMGLQKYIEISFSMIDISDRITGSAQPKLNQAKLNAMQFPIPDKELTDSFLEYIAQVDKSKVINLPLIGNPPNEDS